MAWADAPRQTAVVVPGLVGGIFSAERGEDGRPDAEWVSRKGALGGVGRRFRVVTNGCHVTSVATEDQACLFNIAQGRASGSGYRVAPLIYFQHCAILNSPGASLVVTFTQLWERAQGASSLSPCGAALGGHLPSRNPFTPPRHIFCPQMSPLPVTEKPRIEDVLSLRIKPNKSESASRAATRTRIVKSRGQR
jgi:hypothetical protein